MEICTVVVGHLPVQTPLIFPESIHIVGSHEATEVCHEDGNTTGLNVGLHKIEHARIGWLYDAWIRNEDGNWLVLRVCEPSFGCIGFAGAYDTVL